MTPRPSDSFRRAESLALAVLAAACLVVFFWRYPQTQPAASLGMEVNRGEAIRIAQTHLAGLGVPRTEVKLTNASMQTDHAWNAFLQTEVSNPDELIAFRPWAWWDLLFSASGSDAPIRVRVSPKGEVFAVSRRVGDELVGARVRADSARAVAEQFLTESAGVTMDGFAVQDARVDRREGRSDHTIRWSKPIEDDPASRLRLTMVVAGDQVLSWSRAVEVSPDFREVFDPRESVHTLFDFGVVIIVMLVWLAALVVFALRFRSSEVGVRNGLLAVFALLLAFGWFGFNTAGYATHSAELDSSTALFSVAVYVGLGIQIFFTALGVFFVWNAGESVAREIWPAKLSAFDKLFAQRLFTRDIGAGILRGCALGAILAGAWFLLLPVFQHGHWAVLGNDELLMLSALFPFGVPFAGSLLVAILGLGYAHLFSLAVLRQRFGRVLPAVLVTAVVFGAAFSETTVLLDRWAGSALSVVVGLISYLFFLRYDLWTVFVGLFSARLLVSGSLFLFQPAFMAPGIESMAILVLLLCYGVAAAARGADVEDRLVAPAYVRFISERERLKFELDIARQAQLRMLPDRLPRPSGMEVAAFSEPAREVGGDYYDFMEFPDGRLGVVVGDVSGKGMSAALYMTMLKGYLQSRSETDRSPKSVLSHVNRMFGQASDRSMFATMVYCVMDVNGGSMTFARAGHCPVLVLRETEGSVYVLQPPGIGIGLERTDLFERVTEEETMDLRSGDVVVLYSDGLTEARDAQENEFGNQRLIDLVRAGGDSAETILQRIRTAHSAFVGGREPHDDLTCVVIRLVA